MPLSTFPHNYVPNLFHYSYFSINLPAHLCTKTYTLFLFLYQHSRTFMYQNLHTVPISLSIFPHIYVPKPPHCSYFSVNIPAHLCTKTFTLFLFLYQYSCTSMYLFLYQYSCTSMYQNLHTVPISLSIFLHIYVPKPTHCSYFSINIPAHLCTKTSTLFLCLYQHSCTSTYFSVNIPAHLCTKTSTLFLFLCQYSCTSMYQNLHTVPMYPSTFLHIYVPKPPHCSYFSINIPAHLCTKTSTLFLCIHQHSCTSMYQNLHTVPISLSIFLHIYVPKPPHCSYFSVNIPAHLCTKTSTLFLFPSNILHIYVPKPPHCSYFFINIPAHLCTKTSTLFLCIHQHSCTSMYQNLHTVPISLSIFLHIYVPKPPHCSYFSVNIPAHLCTKTSTLFLCISINLFLHIYVPKPTTLFLCIHQYSCTSMYQNLHTVPMYLCQRSCTSMYQNLHTVPISINIPAHLCTKTSTLFLCIHQHSCTSMYQNLHTVPMYVPKPPHCSYVSINVPAHLCTKTSTLFLCIYQYSKTSTLHIYVPKPPHCSYVSINIPAHLCTKTSTLFLFLYQYSCTSMYQNLHTVPMSLSTFLHIYVPKPPHCSYFFINIPAHLCTKTSTLFLCIHQHSCTSMYQNLHTVPIDPKPLHCLSCTKTSTLFLYPSLCTKTSTLFLCISTFLHVPKPPHCSYFSVNLTVTVSLCTKTSTLFLFLCQSCRDVSICTKTSTLFLFLCQHSCTSLCTKTSTLFLFLCQHSCRDCISMYQNLHTVPVSLSILP